VKDFDYGPLRTYQVTWANGHIEYYQGQQVCLPPPELPSFFGGTATKRRDLITIHGDFDGHWRLVFAAKADLIEAVRDVTDRDLFDALVHDLKPEDGAR